MAGTSLMDKTILEAEMTEAEIQEIVCKWLVWNHKIFNHSPNEGKRSKVTGANLRRLGMSKGFPDIFVYEPIGRYHGIAIELKTLKGRVRPEQADWIQKLSSRGYIAQICYGYTEAINLLEDYFKNG